MKVGDLVKHKEIPTLGYGLVTKNLGAHCMVQWASYATGHPLTCGGPTLEANSMLELANNEAR